MSAKIKYTDEPMGEPEVIPDFLPAPEDLVFKDEGIKVTLALSRLSVELFKREAAISERLLDALREAAD